VNCLSGVQVSTVNLESPDRLSFKMILFFKVLLLVVHLSCLLTNLAKLWCGEPTQMEKSVLEISKSEVILPFSTRSRTKRFLTSALEAVMRLQLEK